MIVDKIFDKTQTQNTNEIIDQKYSDLHVESLHVIRLFLHERQNLHERWRAMHREESIRFDAKGRQLRRKTYVVHTIRKRGGRCLLIQLLYPLEFLHNTITNLDLSTLEPNTFQGTRYIVYEYLQRASACMCRF